MCFQFDRFLRSCWDAAMSKGYFRYTLDEVRSRRVDGKHGYILQVKIHLKLNSPCSRCMSLLIHTEFAIKLLTCKNYFQLTFKLWPINSNLLQRPLFACRYILVVGHDCQFCSYYVSVMCRLQILFSQHTISVNVQKLKYRIHLVC